MIGRWIRRLFTLVLLLVRVFLLTPLGVMAAEKKHTPRSATRRSPARPWGFEARKVGKIGNRAYAVRLQLVSVAI